MATRLLSLLRSIRFARGLLIAIGSVALAGSLIPQQEPLSTYLARFGQSGSAEPSSRWLTRTDRLTSVIERAPVPSHNQRTATE